MPRNAAGLGIAMLAIAASGLTAGCATGINQAASWAQGGHAGGGYALSAWEQKLNCAQLDHAINKRATTMAQLAAKEQAERSGLPKTLLAAVAWSSNGNFGRSQTMKAHDLQRREADALNARRITMNCPLVDIDQRITAEATKLPDASPGATPVMPAVLTTASTTAAASPAAIAAGPTR